MSQQGIDCSSPTISKQGAAAALFEGRPGTKMGGSYAFPHCVVADSELPVLGHGS